MTENSEVEINIIPEVVGVYVDDLINVGDELPKGARYDTKKMIVVEENEKDEDSEHKLIENEVKGDRRTLDILTEMANTIDPDIRMSSEVPSDFSEGNASIFGHTNVGR